MDGKLLDTNVVSESIKEIADENVVSWVELQPAKSLFISVISIGELRNGFERLAKSRRRLALEYWYDNILVPGFGNRILPVTLQIAERWGTLEAEQRRLGTAVPIADGYLAATALTHDLTLVTRNTKDFARVGVRLFNPWEL